MLQGAQRASSGPKAVAGARAEGTAERLAPFKIEGAGIPRQGNPVLAGDEEAGIVTSGSFSPSLEIGVGLAYSCAATWPSPEPGSRSTCGASAGPPA